jgi:hypothetical protein
VPDIFWSGHDTRGNPVTGGLDVIVEPKPIAGRGYRPVFYDDFDTLGPIWGPQPQHRLTVLPDAFTVADSILTVRADTTRARPYEELTTLGKYMPTAPHYPWATAWQYGYFEIRARVTDSVWSKLALWFYGLTAPNYHGTTRPCTVLNAEWDMVENGIRAGWEPGAVADVNHVSVLHRNTGGVCNIPDSSRQYATNGVGLCDWHTWGGLWTPTSVATFLDGRPLGSMATFDTTAQPLYLIVSAAPLTGGQTQPGWPPCPRYIETQVDWVRVWQTP